MRLTTNFSPCPDRRMENPPRVYFRVARAAFLRSTSGPKPFAISPRCKEGAAASLMIHGEEKFAYESTNAPPSISKRESSMPTTIRFASAFAAGERSNPRNRLIFRRGIAWSHQEMFHCCSLTRWYNIRCRKATCQSWCMHEGGIFLP